VEQQEPLRFYFYVIVDVNADPPKMVKLVFTRAEGRAWIEQINDSNNGYRIRRAKATMFER
jgi:hypothetical protein